MRWAVSSVEIAVALVPLLVSQLPALLCLVFTQSFTIPILELLILLVVM
jgi:hypothetical protein